VNVSENTIELSGTVRNSKERHTARRIARSYAGNRKLVDHMKLIGEGASVNPDSQNQPMNENPPGVRTPGNTNDPTNPSPQSHAFASLSTGMTQGWPAGHPDFLPTIGEP
jgi:hypothetical protein